MRSEPIIRTTRTNDGKKFDEWSFAAPEGPHAKFEVMMHHDRDGYSFTAQSRHPALIGLTLENTDVTALRSEATDTVEAAFEAYYGTEWVPALRVKFRHHDRITGVRKSTGCGTTLEFNATHIHQARGGVIGNQGETRILEGAQVLTEIQRGPRDTFETDKDIRRANLKFLTEEPNVSRSIVPGTQENEELARGIDETLKNFALIFGDRLAFAEVSMRGLPSREDLVQMMHEAAHNIMPPSGDVVADESGMDGP